MTGPAWYAHQSADSPGVPSRVSHRDRGTVRPPDEDRAIARSTQLPQRLSLSLRCGDNLVVLSSFPLHADEQVNLRRDAQPSLQGAMGGGGFKKRGGWHNQAAGGSEVLVQELVRRGDSGQELGFYYAFMIGRRYVSILAVGPEANRRELSQATATLRIEPNPGH